MAAIADPQPVVSSVSFQECICYLIKGGGCEGMRHGFLSYQFVDVSRILRFLDSGGLERLNVGSGQGMFNSLPVRL